MKVFWCYYKTDDEWGSFVIAPTPSKAKAMFHHWYSGEIGEGEYTDVRCYKKMKLPDDVKLEAQMLDDPDDPLLKELGLRYATEEEIEELYGWY